MITMKLFLVYLAVILSCCNAYKILVVYPMPARSHKNLGDGIVRHLLADGHEVTYISPFEYNPPSSKLRVVDVSANFAALPEDTLTIEAIMNKTVNVSGRGMMMSKLTEITKLTILNENVQKVLNDPKEQFDLLIVEWMFTDLPAGYAAIFNCPFVWVSSMDVHWMILQLIDEPSNTAYSADITSTNLPPFTFWKRATELYNQLKVRYMKYSFFDRLEEQLYDELLAPIVVKRGRQPPPYSEVKFNASLVLANSHVSLGQSIALPQNYKPIAGYHIDEKVKPLPEDLKNIMDNSKNGVIYFSMGTSLKSKDIPTQIKTDLLKIFGELKQTVLWKFEEDLPNKPNNVHILKWAPQPSILEHPNTVLFITHGGLLSTTETIYFGVPVIGIPVFGDQFLNVAKAVNKGYALKVDLSYKMAGDLKAAIEESTSNHKYTEVVKKLSFVFHDRPTTPSKELQHWVRHVIETGGAPHLRSPAISVPFYQKLYLDLLAIILLTLLVLVKLLKCCVSSLLKKTDSIKKNN